MTPAFQIKRGAALAKTWSTCSRISLVGSSRMHQEQWLGALETMDDHLPVPNSFPQDEENQDHNYEFMCTFNDEHENPGERWTQGKSIDGKSEFSYGRQPGGGKPDLDEVIEEMHNEVS